MRLLAGPGSFRVHGSIYHMIGPLQPPAEQGTPQFVQLYKHGTEHETENRISLIPGLDRTTVAGLQDMLHHHNLFVQRVRSAATRDTPEMQLSIVTGALANCLLM